MSGTASPAYGINPRRRVQVISIGRERSPLLWIDDFLMNADALVAQARDAVFIELGSLYPGVRAPVPAGYIRAMLDAVAPIIHGNFGSLPREHLELCAFSLVTTEPANLRPLQRIPHFDGPEVGRFAFIHYLCGADHGGTSFFRHRATEFECVTPERLDEYRQRLTQQLEAAEPPRAYARGDTQLFEQIHSVPAAFNRLIIYKGNALHSGDISSGARLAEDPLRGRLTINGFGHLAD